MIYCIILLWVAVIVLAWDYFKQKKINRQLHQRINGLQNDVEALSNLCKSNQKLLKHLATEQGSLKSVTQANQAFIENRRAKIEKRQHQSRRNFMNMQQAKQQPPTSI
jgi:uncharacterized membrane-anchored protein YhcB (DUF1043 family)